MAEGDSIHRLARRLNAQLSGKRIVATDFRLPQYATTDLSGLVIDEVHPVGKHLLCRMHDNSGQRITLHSALRMSGQWRVLKPGQFLAREQKNELRLLLNLDDGSSLAAVNMPVLEMIPTEDERTVIGHLGPDLCADEFDLEEAIRRFATQPDRPIIEAWLDQRNACGIGNLWAVELCFLRGDLPWHPVSTVDVPAGLKLVRRMMRYSLLHEAGMITTGNKRKGETHWVYGRYNRPCRRCGTPIKFREGGSSNWDRETWWCPSCQPNHLPNGAIPKSAYKSAASSIPLPKQRGSC